MVSEQDKFAFIIHPIDPQRDVARKYPLLGKLPVWLIELISVLYPPVFISEISGIRSASTGRTIGGWFVACPLTPRLMLKLPPAVVYRKIIQTGLFAQNLGAQLLGLGAFTSVVGDGGITIAQNLDIPVTTGDSYTVAMAVRAIRQAADRMRIDLSSATTAVVGAYGAIGSVTAEMLAPDAGTIQLFGRDPVRLDHVAQRVKAAGARRVDTATDVSRLVEAQLVVTVTSAVDTIIRPEHLQQGAVVCDVARPRDVSRRVTADRPDVLVIEGGMVKVPGPVEFGFDFGFPPRMAYACMAETMALTLEQRYASFTLGKDIRLSQVQTIDKIAARHGFQLGGFRSFERAVTDEQIDTVRAFAASTASAG